MIGPPRRGAPSIIVRNLKILNGTKNLPMRCCRKNTGPGESSLMAIATAANSGRSNTKPEGGTRDVEQPLDHFRAAWTIRRTASMTSLTSSLVMPGNSGSDTIR